MEIVYKIKDSSVAVLRSEKADGQKPVATQ